VNDQLIRLIHLERIDAEISKNRDAQQKIPLQLATAQQRFTEAQATLTRISETLTALQKERRGKEQDLKIAEEKIAHRKARLADLKTNKEYQAHMSEIDMARREMGKIEEQILLLMEKGDQLQREIAHQQEVVAAEERAFFTRKAQADQRLHEIAEAVARLSAAWTEQSAGIEASTLDAYRKLIDMRRHPAVVPLRGQTCGGCNFSLPPQQAAEIQIGEKMIRCSYCHRFLYPQPPVEVTS